MAQHEVRRAGFRKGLRQGLKGEDRFLAGLLAGQTVHEACAAANISMNTGYRHLRDSDFQRKLITLRQEIIRNVKDRLIDASNRAVDALLELLDDQASSANTRLGAAKAILALVLPKESVQEQRGEMGMDRELRTEAVIDGCYEAGLYADEASAKLYQEYRRARDQAANGMLLEPAELSRLTFALLRLARQRLTGDSETVNQPLLLRGPNDANC